MLDLYTQRTDNGDRILRALHDDEEDGGERFQRRFTDRVLTVATAETKNDLGKVPILGL